MRTIRDTLKKLSEITGKELSEKELKTACEMAEATGMSESDPFLHVALVLEWYWNRMEEMPRRIEAAQDKTAEVAKAKLDGAVADIVATLKGAVVVEAKKASGAAAVKEAARWAAAAVVVVALAFCGVSMHERGQARAERVQAYNDGVEAGRVKERNEELVLKQRDEFTKTPEFGRAFKMHQSGGLKSMLDFAGTADYRWALWMREKGMLKELRECTRPGWAVQDGDCIPFSINAEGGKIGTYGWPMMQ
ncbi:MAG: hypothetical protein K6F46_06130 [Desulfovibrio sp.]|nr:hypothetical protein [Desulfovibrio sp.]